MFIDTLFVSNVAVDDLDLDNQPIKDYCYSLKENQPSSRYSNIGGWHSELITGHIPVLNKLFVSVSHRLNALHKHFNFRDDMQISISNFWVNINGRGHANAPHTHRGFTFSGVYFVQGGEGSGDLVLVHPSQQFPYHYTDQPFKDNSIDKSLGTVQYTPQPGRLVIFPSWIQHYVQPNLTDSDRVSIAFDVILTEVNNAT